METFGFDLEEIARLIRLVETRGLSELIFEEEGQRIVIRGVSAAKSAAASAPLPAFLDAGEMTLTSDAPPHSNSGAIPEYRIILTAPMTGVFYRSARPDSPPFVEIGDHVEIGQTIGLVEAMKVFSEIPAEQAGIVVEIPSRSGQLVREGEPLLYLKPD